jgi:DNA-directed RNA polymerase specialized sigma24 family protein
MSTTVPVCPSPSLATLHGCFQELLPHLRGYTGKSFHFLENRHDREDAVAETVALCWAWYARLASRGKDAGAFVRTLARYAVKHVKGGRRSCGAVNTRDVLTPEARRRRGFEVLALPTDTREFSAWEEALQDNTQTPVPEQVVFQVDFGKWRAGRSERDRRLVDDLMLGERTLDLSSKYGLTAGRISQMRREFHQDWTRFCTAPVEC